MEIVIGLAQTKPLLILQSMNNDGMVQDLCFTTGIESEIVFAPDHKLISFVGE
jgi:hypothetical protein